MLPVILSVLPISMADENVVFKYPDESELYMASR